MKFRLLLLLGAVAAAAAATFIERNPLGDSSFALHAAVRRIRAVWQSPSATTAPPADGQTAGVTPAVPGQPVVTVAPEQAPARGDCTNPRSNTDLRHCDFSTGLPSEADFSGADLRGVRIGGVGEQGELKNLASHHVAFRIVFEPLLGVLLATVLWSHLLVKIRLELSSEVVDAFAANVLRDGILTADANQPRQLGLFAVEQVRVSNGAVKLFTCQDGIFGASGLIYSPKAKPENIGEESFSPLAEPWYAWKQTW